MNLVNWINNLNIDVFFEGVYSTKTQLEYLKEELVSKQKEQSRLIDDFESIDCWINTDGENSEEDRLRVITDLESVISYLKIQIGMFKYSTKCEYETLNRELKMMIKNNENEIKKIEEVV